MNKKWTALLCVFGLLASAVQAQTTIVDFTNTPSTGSIETAAVKDTDSNGLDAWNFDDASPLFSGSRPGSNTRIYGGLTATWESAVAYNPTFQLLANATGAAYIQINPGTITGLNTFKSMMVWKKEDFLNGASTQTIQFGAGDAMSINFSQITANTGSATYDFRFVVKQDNKYYVSSANKTDATLGSFSIVPSTTTWAEINTTNYNIASYNPLSLNDVQAVGIYMNLTRTSLQVITAFTDFQATATAIPEPSTYAALAGLGALGLVVWRRRRSGK